MASLLGPGGVGSRAPVLDLSTAAGERRTLEHFKDRPLLVTFLGPAHCLFCRAHVIRLIQAKDEIESLCGEVKRLASLPQAPSRRVEARTNV